MEWKIFLLVFLFKVIYFVWECKENGMVRFIIGIMKMKVRGGEGYYLVAESFGKFILSFEKKPMELSNIDDIEIELDDDLLD